MELTKVIITIPKDKYQYIQELEQGNTDYATTRMLYHAVKKGTPLDSDSERAETQAYFDGEAYGWEQGRKALIEELKAEIDQLPLVLLAGNYHIDKDYVMEILDRIGAAEREVNPDE